MNPPLEDSDGDEEMIPEPSGENMDQPLRSGTRPRWGDF